MGIAEDDGWGTESREDALMPSLAQGYGGGLLSGLEIMERKRRLQQDELLDEYRREQLQDIRWGREKEKKSLLAQIKEKEEMAKRQELIGDIAAIEAGGLRTGEQFMRSILGGEETPPETKERLTSVMDYVPGLSLEDQFKRTRVAEKVEGAPGARPWGVSEIGEGEIPRAARMALGLEPKAATPTLPADWLKAPGKQESAVQKWLTDWEKHIFEKRTEEELETEVKTEYPKLKLKSTLAEELAETERAEAAKIIKRRHFNKWIKRVPVGLRSEVREWAGMDVETTPSPPEEEPEYTQEQMDSYNACRDRGGDEEECRLEAGL